MRRSKLAKLKGMSPWLEKDAAKAKDPADATQMHAPADIRRWPSNLLVDDSQMQGTARRWRYEARCVTTHKRLVCD